MKRSLFLTIAFILTLAVPLWATTYYVGDSKNVTTSGTPSDANNGLSWSAPWASLTKINTTVAAGDTVYFATGIWRGRLVPATGTYADRTCYADSAFADTNGDGEYHFAKIWGSDSVTNWTQIGTSNVYRTTTRGYSGFVACYQGDSVLLLQADSASVNSPGEIWSNSAGSTIAYVYNTGAGYDPDNYDIECSQTGELIDMRADDANGYFTVYGMEFKYTNGRIVSFGADPGYATVDSCFLLHCKFSHVFGWAGTNPSCIYSSQLSSDRHQDNMIRACSIGYAWSYYPTPAVLATSHGAGACFYGMANSIVDSCWIYGYFGLAGLYFKNDGATSGSGGNVWRYNDITTTHGAGMLTYLYIDGFDIYGNIIHDCGTGVNVRLTTVEDCSDEIRIRNNTFYNCTTPLYHGGEGTYRVLNSTVKYNVIYSQGNQRLYLQTADSTMTDGWYVDSNMIYTGGTLTLSTSGTTRTTSAWQGTFGHDVHSSFATDPEFNDAANGDFSRSDTTEMSVTYGGRTWTMYGAWQPGDPTVEIDVTPPATVFDLGALPGDEHGEMTLSWTAAGDDLWDGTARRYEVMWSLEPITEDLWTPMFTGYDCVPGGGSQEITVAGLEAGRVYFVAVKTYDETGQASGLSNYAESFAGGIVTPPALVTAVDEGSQSAMLSCAAVTSYYDPLSYDFALTDSGSVDTTVLNVGTVVDGRVSAVFEDLSASSSYYWRCRAVAAGLDAGEWSVSKKFRLSNVVPDPPTVNQPGDFDTLVVSSDPVTLTVNAGVDEDGPNPLTYQFELYDSTGTNLLASDSNVVGQDSVIDWPSPVTLTSAQYHWRARCFDGIDYSSWMDLAHFQLVAFSSGGLDDDYFKVIAYPNPVRFTQSEEVTFRLPETPVDLFIQTISGETVRLETGVSGDWVWNGENESGNTVSIGIYLWSVRGTDRHGKIVVKP